MAKKKQMGMRQALEELGRMAFLPLEPEEGGIKFSEKIKAMELLLKYLEGEPVSTENPLAGLTLEELRRLAREGDGEKIDDRQQSAGAVGED